MKFMKYYVESDTGDRVKCWYMTTERNGKKCIMVVASNYGDRLSFLPNVENNTDSQTDYFEKDSASIYEGDPLYAAALARVEKNDADDRAKREAKIARFSERYRQATSR
jgi:hypothetical protein